MDWLRLVYIALVICTIVVFIEDFLLKISEEHRKYVLSALSVADSEDNLTPQAILRQWNMNEPLVRVLNF